MPATTTSPSSVCPCMWPGQTTRRASGGCWSRGNTPSGAFPASAGTTRSSFIRSATCRARPSCRPAPSWTASTASTRTLLPHLPGGGGADVAGGAAVPADLRGSLRGRWLLAGDTAAQIRRQRGGDRRHDDQRLQPLRLQNMLQRGALASGSYTGTVPNMVSYYYGFTGPSYFLDTMCSAAASCVHRPCTCYAAVVRPWRLRAVSVCCCIPRS